MVEINDSVGRIPGTLKRRSPICWCTKSKVNGVLEGLLVEVSKLVGVLFMNDSRMIHGQEKIRDICMFF